MKRIQYQAIIRKYPMLLKLLKNLKSKAIVSLEEKRKKYKMISQRYPILLKLVKNLKAKASKSL